MLARVDVGHDDGEAEDGDSRQPVDDAGARVLADDPHHHEGDQDERQGRGGAGDKRVHAALLF